MKIYLPTCLIVLLSTLVLGAEPSIVTAKADLEKLTKVFPSLYWHASDACLRETSKVGGQLQSHDEFVKENRADIEKLEEATMKGLKTIKSQVRLHDPEDPKEYWIFTFLYRGQGWEADTATKHVGKPLEFDIYESDPFMGSMKPYIAKGLAALVQGKDFKPLFRKP